MSEVTLVVSVPLAQRAADQFRKSVMPRAEAEQMAAEINERGTINGLAAHAFILDGAVARNATPAPKRDSRHSRASNAPFMPNRHRKVRASDPTWRGERSGNRIDRITAGMRAWDK